MNQLASPKDPGDGKLLKLWMPWTQTLILLTRITSQCSATPYLVAGSSRENPLLHEPNHSLLTLLATKYCYPPTSLEQPG
ncbi:hypothetical protein TNCV_2315801 [Trichonephila clavipes]|nr:hypothetical protein TNCV_2315801 [Trichonephila clavipes]